MAVYRPDPRLFQVQVESIRDQELRNWRCLVGIDGFDPKTRALAEELCADARFEIFEYPENVGFYRNFERLLGEVPQDATWVALCDQDDRWYPEKLATMVPRVAEPDVTAVVCQARVVNDDGEVLSFTNRHKLELVDLLIENQVSGSMAVFRGDVIALGLPFPEHADYVFHDHWLGVLALALGTILYLPDVLQDYVQHGGNEVGELERISWLRRIRNIPVRPLMPTSAFRYVSSVRWGWRVQMARALVSNVSGAIPDSVRSQIEPFSGGRYTLRLGSMVARSLRRGQISRMRTLGLLAGSLAWTEKL